MKDSGVEWLGEVPEHWTVTRLGNHAIKIGSAKLQEVVQKYTLMRDTLLKVKISTMMDLE
jgi:hypothetical protein